MENNVLTSAKQEARIEWRIKIGSFTVAEDRSWSEGFEAGYKAKNAELTAERDRYKWVKITDCLPEQDGGYLITDDEGFMLIAYFQAKKQRFLVVQDALATNVVAWMPLPEPYEVAQAALGGTDGRS